MDCLILYANNVKLASESISFVKLLYLSQYGNIDDIDKLSRITLAKFQIEKWECPIKKYPDSFGIDLIVMWCNEDITDDVYTDIYTDDELNDIMNKFPKNS